MGILNRTITHKNLLKNILLLPPVIMSGYTLKENTMLASKQQELETKLKYLEKNTEKIIASKDEKIFELEEKLKKLSPSLQNTDEVKIDSSSADMGVLETLNNPLVQTSIKLIGMFMLSIVQLCYKTNSSIIVNINSTN